MSKRTGPDDDLMRYAIEVCSFSFSFVVLRAVSRASVSVQIYMLELFEDTFISSCFSPSSTFTVLLSFGRPFQRSLPESVSYL